MDSIKFSPQEEKEIQDRLKLTTPAKAHLIIKCWEARLKGTLDYYPVAEQMGVDRLTIDRWIGEYSMWKAHGDKAVLKYTSRCVKYFRADQKKKEKLELQTKWKSILWDRVRIRISK